MLPNLDDANAVGDVKGIVVLGEADEGLLLAIRADQGVDLEPNWASDA